LRSSQIWLQEPHERAPSSTGRSTHLSRVRVRSFCHPSLLREALESKEREATRFEHGKQSVTRFVLASERYGTERSVRTNRKRFDLILAEGNTRQASTRQVFTNRNYPIHEQTIHRSQSCSIVQTIPQNLNRGWALLNGARVINNFITPQPKRAQADGGHALVGIRQKLHERASLPTQIRCRQRKPRKKSPNFLGMCTRTAVVSFRYVFGML